MYDFPCDQDLLPVILIQRLRIVTVDFFSFRAQYIPAVSKYMILYTDCMAVSYRMPVSLFYIHRILSIQQTSRPGFHQL